MIEPAALCDLLSAVAHESDVTVALSAIADSAKSWTQSRHVIIAVLNEQQGILEIQAGSGEGFFNIGREEGIVGFVAATGEQVKTGNVWKDSRYRRMFDSTQSELAVPAKDEYGRVRAVLNVESERGDAYGESERDILVALASVVALVLAKQDHKQREEALFQVGSSLDSVLTEEALVDRIVHIAEEVLRLQACSIFLLDRKLDRFVLRGTIGRLRNEIGQLSYARGEGFTGWVCDKGEPILLENPQEDPRWRGKYVEFPSEQIAGFLAVPIVGRQGSIGAIRVLRRKTENEFLDNRFTADDLRLVQAIAEQVATGLENLRNMDKIIRSERMIAWGELSAKSSHMIGNRVFALKGDVNELGHVLQEKNLDPALLEELQKSLNVNLTRIEEILQDFRDFVTATQLNRQPADLRELVSETAQEVFPRRSEVELSLDLQPLPTLSIDGKKLRRAISELIENSLNHMSHGQMRITTDVVPNTEYGRTAHSRVSQFARVIIEDTGPGVDLDQKALIFQPFFSNRVRGMGLGLSIVKGIVDAHGGDVFEDGDEGSGAKFVILLPCDS